MYVRSHSFPFLPGKVHDFSLTRSRKKKKKSPSPSLHSGHGKCLFEATKCHFTSSGQLYCHIPLPGCTAFMLPWAHNDFTLQSLFFLLFFLSISVTPTPPQWWRRGFRQGLILQAVFGKKSGKEEGSGEQAQSCGAVHPSNIKGSILQADGLGE